MARMSIDDMFLRDTRVLTLAKALGEHRFQTQGRLINVFALAYDRVEANKGHLLLLRDIDTAAELEGFGHRMIEFDLAVMVRDRVRIRGAEDRTLYLATRQQSGRQGGIKSGETRRNQAKVTFEANGRSPSKQNAKTLNPSAPDLPSASASADPIPTHTQNARARDGFGDSSDRIARAILEKLGRHAGVAFSGHPTHLALIGEQLAAGRTEDDLRAVIAYCAIELDWESRPEMRVHLKPETLFDRDKIVKYLDPARSWAASLSPSTAIGTSP